MRRWLDPRPARHRAGPGRGGLLRAAGERHGGARVLADGAFDPAGVGRGAGPAAGARGSRGSRCGPRRLATAIAVLLGLPVAFVLHRLALPGRRLIRAALLVPFVLPTVVVGVAFRLLLGEAGPLGFLGLDGTPVAIIAGLVFFNVAVVIRAVGAAWESLDTRPAEAAAALGATPAQVWWTVTLPALRPAIVSRGQRRLPVLRHRVRDRAHPRRGALRDRRDRDLPAHHDPLRPARRGRALGAAARRRGRPARARRPAARDPRRHGQPLDRPAAPDPLRRRAGDRGDRAGARRWSRADRHARAGLLPHRRRLVAWPTTAPSPASAATTPCWCR